MSNEWIVVKYVTINAQFYEMCTGYNRRKNHLSSISTIYGPREVSNKQNVEGNGEHVTVVTVRGRLSHYIQAASFLDRK